jgi:hypothetical protein
VALDKEIEQETQVDADLAPALADISSDLFGEAETGINESEGVENPSEGEGIEAGQSDAEGETSDSPPQSSEQETGDNSAEVQATGAPETWTKEALEDWAKIPPRAQQEILKREEDMHRGIEGYRAAADMGSKVSKIIEPYAPILAAENIDPFQMLQSFAGNHYILSRGTDDQKLQVAANLLAGYNIPLAPLLNYMAENDAIVEQEDPKIVALRKELNDIKSGISTQQTAAQTAAMEHIGKEIDAFEADPANPYFKELANDIHQLFATGQASNLREAYDKAVWNNPVTRQKEIDRLTAEKTSAAEQEEKERSERKAKAQGDKLQVGDKPRDGTVLAGSIDDTLKETMERINAR